MTWGRIFWAALCGGNRNGDPLCYSKRTVLLLLLLTAIDSTTLDFMFVRRGAVSHIFSVQKFVYSFGKLQFLRVDSELLGGGKC